jgi:hypothetical protein
MLFDDSRPFRERARAQDDVINLGHEALPTAAGRGGDHASPGRDKPCARSSQGRLPAPAIPPGFRHR